MNHRLLKSSHLDYFLMLVCLWHEVKCVGLCSYQQNEDVWLEIRRAYEISSQKPDLQSICLLVSEYYSKLFHASFKRVFLIHLLVSLKTQERHKCSRNTSKTSVSSPLKENRVGSCEMGADRRDYCKFLWLAISTAIRTRGWGGSVAFSSNSSTRRHRSLLLLQPAER